MYQTTLVRDDDQLSTVAGRQLRQQARHVGFGRRLADEQLRGDLLVRQAPPDEAEYLQFPVGEDGQLGPAGGLPGLDAGVVAGELLDQAAGYRRRKQGLAGRDDPNRVEQLLRGYVFQQKP